MLPKQNRAFTRGVEEIFKKGEFISSSNLNFKFILTGNPTPPKISFITPKTVAKLAVKRNMLRRRGYNALRKYINDFPLGVIGVFLFKKYQENVLTIENEIKNILYKIS